MPYNNQITRNDAQALIPSEVSKEIFNGLATSSVVLNHFRRLPDMTRKQLSVPVLDLLPMAYWVSGDDGLKQTTNQSWSDKVIHAEELAVIVTIPEAVLNDAEYDIWAEVEPRLVEAFGKAIDEAVLFGVNKPVAWRDSIYDTIVDLEKYTVLGSDTLYTDLLGDGGVISQIEESGYMPTGHIASVNMRSKLRGIKDLNDHPLFRNGMNDGTTYTLDGTPMVFPLNGSFDGTKALLISGDFNQAVYAIRQDITFKLLTEGVITDNNKNIIYNLAQQDMVALRAVMRLGWEIPNPVNALDHSVSRFPFAALIPESLVVDPPAGS